jgi:hypothetical protein
MGETEKAIVTVLGNAMKGQFARQENKLNDRLARFEKVEKQASVTVDNSLVAQALQQVAAAVREQSKILERQTNVLAEMFKMMTKKREKRTLKGKIGEEDFRINEE